MLLATALKLLLVPCYKSTDFEVHRNWLAVTGTLPLARWYTEATSPWTLDYPPLFAWFERALACVAPLADPGMLTLRADPYDTPRTVLFQRSTVMAGDGLLMAGVLWQTSGAYGGASEKGGRGVTPRALGVLLVVFSPGLLLVDHVHFQYNGMLLGLQLCSLAALGHGHPTLAAFLFSMLLHAKHIFVYAAPAMAAHLLLFHALELHARQGRTRVAIGRCVGFLAVAAAVTAVSFGPFAAEGQLANMFARLFPFGRGLSHAYWAPNAWALYNVVDKAAVAVARRCGFTVVVPEGNLAGGMTGHGGTGAQTHAMLPTVTPASAFALVLAAMTPGIVAHCRLWEPWGGAGVTQGVKPSGGREAERGRGRGRAALGAAVVTARHRHLLRLVAHVTLCAFMFGWHVHEKASLMVTVPLALALASEVAASSVGGASPAAAAATEASLAFASGEYLFLSTVANYAIAPLLFQPREWPIKIIAIALGAAVSRGVLRRILTGGKQGEAQREGVQPRDNSPPPPRLLGRLQWWYLAIGLPAVEVYVAVGHSALFGTGRLEFLPLMLTSVYCAAGMVFTWGVQVAGYMGWHTSRAYLLP